MNSVSVAGTLGAVPVNQASTLQTLRSSPKMKDRERLHPSSKIRPSLSATWPPQFIASDPTPCLASQPCSLKARLFTRRRFACTACLHTPTRTRKSRVGVAVPTQRAAVRFVKPGVGTERLLQVQHSLCAASLFIPQGVSL